jgi:hypothetical protein
VEELTALTEPTGMILVDEMFVALDVIALKKMTECLKGSGQ